jgi:hypothetical protein
MTFVFSGTMTNQTRQDLALEALPPEILTLIFNMLPNTDRLALG